MISIPITKEAYKLLHNGTLCLAQMEANGMRIDVPYLEKAIRKAERKAKAIEESLREDDIYKIWKARFGNKASLDSGQQLGTIIFEELKHKPTRITASGKFATDVEAFKDIDLPFVKDLLKMRKLKNTTNTFLRGIQKELDYRGYIHPSLNLNTVSTYRSSANEPNAHNWPHHDEEQAALVRRAIIPEPGWYLWELDFKSSEVIWNGIYSGDPNLVSYCTNKRKDMHRDEAANLFIIKKTQVSKPVRSMVKNKYTFANFYGSYFKNTGPALWDAIHRLKLTIEGTDIPLTKHLRKQGIRELGDLDDVHPGTFLAHVRECENSLWDKRFPIHDQWRKNNYALYQKQGYLETLTGFTLVHGKGGYLSRNDSFCYPVQASSFHGLLWVLIELQRYITKHRMKTKLIGEIHDSGLGTSPKEERDDVLGEAHELVTVGLPKHWPCINIPISIEIECGDIDESWHNKKPYELSNAA